MRFMLGIVVLILTPVISLAQAPSTDGPPGFVLWNSELIDSTADRLEQELGDKHMVYQTIGNYPGHSMYRFLEARRVHRNFMKQNLISMSVGVVMRHS